MFREELFVSFNERSYFGAHCQLNRAYFNVVKLKSLFNASDRKCKKTTQLSSVSLVRSERYPVERCRRSSVSATTATAAERSVQCRSG